MGKRTGSPSIENLQQQLAALNKHIKRKLTEKRDLGESSSSDEQDLLDPMGENDQSSEEDGQVSDKEAPNEVITQSQPTKDLEIADGEKANDQFPELDEEMRELLEDESDLNRRKRFIFHPTLAATWEKILRQGLKKEKKEELLERYPRDGNCPIATPKLNAEIEASINETSRKRDKFFAADLDLCGSSLSALGLAITMIFNNSVQPIDTKELLANLVDAGRLLCDLHAQLIKARKAYLYPSLDKKAKAILEKTNTGEFLFGDDLSQKIKSAKSVEKLGLSLQKAATEKKPTFNASSTLNWRGPPGGVRNYAQTGRRYMNGQRVPISRRSEGKHRPSVQGQGRPAHSSQASSHPPVAGASKN